MNWIKETEVILCSFISKKSKALSAKIISYLLLSSAGNLPLLQLFTNSLVISQKGESQNGDDKKTKHAKFPEKKKRFLPSDTHMHVCVSGATKCSFFSGKFGMLCFLNKVIFSCSTH